MSKRLLAIVCALVLVVTCCFTGCGGKFTKVNVSGIEIEEQQYHSGSDHYVVLVMKNKSSNDCDAEVSVSFLDASGKEVDSRERTVYGFQKNGTAVEKIWCGESFASCNYNVQIKTPTEQCADKDLKVTTKKQKAFVTVTAKNKGTMPIEAEYIALFYKSGNLVYSYSADFDDTIMPKASMMAYVTCAIPYDKVKVYVRGYYDV